MDKVQTIDQYIAQYPEPVRSLLQNVRATVHSVAPNASEKIAYGIPTFTMGTHLVHFAAAKHHLGFYPTSGGVEAFRDRLSEYRVSKGAIQFPYDKPIPYALISEITAYRVAEVLKRS